jgi:hypothetical protein
MARAETTGSPAVRGQRGAGRLLPRRLAALLLAASLPAALAPVARAGDAELARFLLKGGKDDIAKKQYEQAATKLVRAETEDPELVEAAYWLGVVGERRNDVPGAIAQYRRFCAAVQAKKSPTKEESALQKKAQERLAALAAGETERRKIDDAFVEALFAFARANFVRDPTITAEALRMLLEVRPEHEEARKLVEKLGAGGVRPPEAGKPEEVKPEEQPEEEKPGPAAAAGTTPTSKLVKKWTEYLSGSVMGRNDGWTYDGGLLTIEKAKGTMTRPSKHLPSGPKYVVEMEARLVENLGSQEASIGFVFAYRPTPGKTPDDASFYFFLVNETSAILHRVHEGSRGDVFRADLKPVGLGKWHRLAVVVQGTEIEMWVDGRKVTTHEAQERDDLSGEVGVFHQGSKAEVRSLRCGAIP